LKFEAWCLQLVACGLGLPAYCLLLIASKKIPPFYRGEMRSGGVGVLYFQWAGRLGFHGIGQLDFLRVGFGFSLMRLN
jgi:hypothetical protein